MDKCFKCGNNHPCAKVKTQPEGATVQLVVEMFYCWKCFNEEFKKVGNQKIGASGFVFKSIN